jgi:hypothetical protein
LTGGLVKLTFIIPPLTGASAAGAGAGDGLGAGAGGCEQPSIKPAASTTARKRYNTLRIIPPLLLPFQ